MLNPHGQPISGCLCPLERWQGFGGGGHHGYNATRGHVPRRMHLIPAAMRAGMQRPISEPMKDIMVPHQPGYRRSLLPSVASCIAFPRFPNEEEQDRAAASSTSCRRTRPGEAADRHGRAWPVAAVYDSGQPGPTLLFRAELDALPIEELFGMRPTAPPCQASRICAGMTAIPPILAAMARQCSGPQGTDGRGRVVLMFQPAEETGNGAAGVVRRSPLRKDPPRLHLLAAQSARHPARPCAAEGRRGELRLRAGMRIVLSGKTAHSSMPETVHLPDAGGGRNSCLRWPGLGGENASRTTTSPW